MGAVIGFIVGATLGRIVGFAVSSTDLSDMIGITVGGLGGALVCAWLGLRLSGRLRRSATPS
jgi:hypothetical protein